MPETTATANDKIDLRALLQSRKANNARPTVKATICLDPDLLSQLNDLLAQRADRDRARGDDGDPDPRMGKVDQLARQIAEVEADVASRSVVAVFRIPSRERQAELNTAAEEGDDIDPGLVIECFLHFLRDGVKIDPEDLGRDDLAVWVSLASRGEVNQIAFEIVSKSLGRPDFPASVLRSMRTPS